MWGVPRLVFFFQLINLEKQGSMSKGTVHGVPLHIDLDRLLGVTGRKSERERSDGPDSDEGIRLNPGCGG